jgi:hypothetical protein
VKSDWRRWLFYVAAIYDGLFGLIFFFFWPQLYAHFQITPPNHDGYVRFPALLLIIFGFMFLQIARDPDRNRNLIGYGIALKIAYPGLVFWYQLTTPGIPAMWIPWAWCDVGFLVLFALAFRRRLQ